MPIPAPTSGTTRRYPGRRIEKQLLAFAQGMRQNDISEQVRTIARQLTPEEMSRRVLRRRPLACLEARAGHGGDGTDHARGLVTSSGSRHSCAARSVFTCY